MVFQIYRIARRFDCVSFAHVAQRRRFDCTGSAQRFAGVLRQAQDFAHDRLEGHDECARPSRTPTQSAPISENRHVAVERGGLLAGQLGELSEGEDWGLLLTPGQGAQLSPSLQGRGVELAVEDQVGGQENAACRQERAWSQGISVKCSSIKCSGVKCSSVTVSCAERQAGGALLWRAGGVWHVYNSRTIVLTQEVNGGIFGVKPGVNPTGEW